MTTLKCLTCNKKFQVKAYRIKTAKFCSQKCFGRKLGFQKSNKIRLGIKHTEKTKLEMRKSRKGHKPTSFTFLDRKHTLKTREKMSLVSTGKPKSEEHKKNLSKNHADVSGEKNPNWQDGKSFEPYSVGWTKALRRNIRERDHYICQISGLYGNCVHHIDYDKKNCDPKNLITLSRRWNTKINYNRKYWIIYFKNIMKKKQHVK